MKKILLFFSLLFLSSLFCFAQGVWTPRASIPSYGRCGAVGFSIGQYGYMGLGTDATSFPDSVYTDFWRFDPSINSWKRMADCPDSDTFLSAFFVIGNYGYIVTGNGVWSASNSCWQYNVSTNKWTQKANFPGSP